MHRRPCDPDGRDTDQGSFKVVFSLSPDGREAPLGNGLAMVLPVYREALARFLGDWERELRQAIVASGDGLGPTAFGWLPRG